MCAQAWVYAYSAEPDGLAHLIPAWAETDLACLLGSLALSYALQPHSIVEYQAPYPHFGGTHSIVCGLRRGTWQWQSPEGVAFRDPVQAQLASLPVLRAVHLCRLGLRNAFIQMQVHQALSLTTTVCAGLQ